MPFQAKQDSLRLFSFLARALPSAPQAARKTLPSSPRHPSPSRTVAGRPLRLPSRAVLFRLSISFSAPSFSPHEPVVSRAFPRPVLCLPAVPLPRAIPRFSSLPASPRTSTFSPALRASSPRPPSSAPCSLRSGRRPEILCAATDRIFAVCARRMRKNAAIKKIFEKSSLISVR